MSFLPDVKEYWELAEEDRRYPAMGNVWQIDFSCTLTVQGAYMYPIAELHTADQNYYLIESDIGEVGWIQKTED